MGVGVDVDVDGVVDAGVGVVGVVDDDEVDDAGAGAGVVFVGVFVEESSFASVPSLLLPALFVSLVVDGVD